MNTFRLARVLAVLALACLGCAASTPFFYGWHVPAAWLILAVCFASLSHAEANRVRRSRRMTRRARSVVSRNVRVLYLPDRKP